MTDEQIKQNAEAYSRAVNSPDFNWRDDDNIARVAYITGAHSRDEEIADLKLQIKELSETFKLYVNNKLA